MTLYFLSKTPAALRLNGCYAGIIDGFERRIETAQGENVLAEIVPGNNAEGLNFFIDDDFFRNPPDFADVYLMNGDALIYVKRFSSKDCAVKVIHQTRFCGNLITLFSQGGVQLSCEGDGFELYELDDAFADARFEETQIGGYPVLVISAKGCLCIVSSAGRRVFYNAAESYSCGNMLEVTVNFETCAGCRGICSFGYDGEKMELVKSRTEETKKTADDVLHFAFFECVLTRGDYAAYLGDGIRGKADALRSYLGEFVSVTLPPSKFCAEHVGIKAAGLVYPKSKNLFEVKYYGVEIENGKIGNIFEI